MKSSSTAILATLSLLTTIASAGEVKFATKPTASKVGSKVKIAFTVSSRTDVEVAILDAKGKVVRHLAAGVLGGEKAPPKPLKKGLSQSLEWDGKDNFGKAAKGGPFKLRVRAGTGVKFGRFIGEDPCNFGSLESVVADASGNVYIAGSRGQGNQMAMCVRVFDAEGRYQRELVPFPANLPAGSMKKIARWDAAAKSWRPRNLRNLNPDFYGQPGRYWANPAFILVGASAKGGVLLTNGSSIFKIDARGAVAGKSFSVSRLWGKRGLPNSGGGPTHLAPSPDGKYLYLSGPYSAKTYTGYVFNPAYPPARVYRMEIGKGTMKPFVTLPTVGKQPLRGQWTSKHISHPGNYTAPHGPIHGVAVDKEGNVYVADQDGKRVAVFNEAGKEVGKIDIGYPDVIAVHPKTGAVYVLTKEIKGYGKYKKTLVKFSSWKNAKLLASLDLGMDGYSGPKMALAAGKKSTVLWISGVRGGLMPVADKGAALEPVKNQFIPRTDVPRDWSRLATDFERDEIYVSNGCTNFWRYDGQTSKGGLLKRGKAAFRGTDLAVGYNGLLYVRTGKGFSGPFERFDRELKPAPFKGTGTHVLSPYIYSRKGNGMAERGLGVGPDGTVYLSFMYKWVAYAIGGWGPDGKPLPGKYLKGKYPSPNAKLRKQYAPGMNGAIIGPVPQMNGGIRVDLKGDIYVGMMYRPKGMTACDAPKGFEKDQAYRVTVGSVVRFGPEGGTMPGKEGVTRTTKLEGVKQTYHGLAPFSASWEAFGSNTCCVCRVPRFDLDRYGRLILPNAITNSVVLYDNAGNKILEFGKYGNFDSQYVNPNTEAGKSKKPTIASPAIPLAWPTCAGFTEKALYVLDTYNRRALRVEKTYKVEELISF
jgi:DNA-binding beta-propeller fold protein YncE